jgi:hypothetical protein
MQSARQSRRSRRLKLSQKNWLAALDDFRNWLALGFQPEKLHENP